MSVTLYNENKKKIGRFSEKKGRSVIAEKLIGQGNYYLQLSGRGKNNDHTHPYLLSLALDTTDVNEMNNSFDYATVVDKMDYTVKGTIRSARDQDFYKFQLAQDSVVGVSVTSVPDNIAMSVRIYDVHKKKIGEKYQKKGISVLADYLLEKGSYYVQLSDRGNKKSSSLPYELKLTQDISDTFEINNSFDQAASIEIAQTVNGSISPVSDRDFYRFQVKKQGGLNVIVTSPESTKDVSIQIYDEHKKEKKRFIDRIGTGINRNFTVEKGIHYINLSKQNHKERNPISYAMKLTLAGP